MSDYIACMEILNRKPDNPMDDAIRAVQRSIPVSRLDITLERLHLAGRLAGEEFEKLDDDDKKVILTDEPGRKLWDRIDILMWKVGVANLVMLVAERMLEEPDYSDSIACNLPLYESRLKAYKKKLEKLRPERSE